MGQHTIIFSAITLLVAVFMHTVGMFVPKYLSLKGSAKTGLSEYQKEMMRHGHIYVSALLCLSLLGQIFLDFATLPVAFAWVIRFTLPIGACLRSCSYFLAASNRSEAKCSFLGVFILRLAQLLLGFSMVAIAIGLLFTYVKLG